MSEIAKRTLLKIKKQGQIYDLFAKSNARNVECVDAEGNKSTLKAVLTDIFTKLDNSTNNENALDATIKNLQIQVNSIIENSDTEALNSLKEIAAWITEHKDEYSALAQLVEGLPQNKTVSEYVEESIAAVKDTLEEEISSSKSEVLEKLEEAVPTLEDDTSGKVLVNRNGVNTWENLIQVTPDDINVEDMQEGVLYCILLEDDPQEVTQENILSVMADCDNIILTENVEIPKDTVYNGTIDANGYTITLVD